MPDFITITVLKYRLAFILGKRLIDLSDKRCKLSYKELIMDTSQIIIWDYLYGEN